MSKRKPFNDCAGYIASKKNHLTDIHNVIYLAAEQGIDGEKYVTVCEAHKQMIGSSSLPKARVAMKNATQWCSTCFERSISLAPNEENDGFHGVDEPCDSVGSIKEQSALLESRRLNASN